MIKLMLWVLFLRKSSVIFEEVLLILQLLLVRNQSEEFSIKDGLYTDRRQRRENQML